MVFHVYLMGGNADVARLLLFPSPFRPEEPSLTSSDQQTISRWFNLECLFSVIIVSYLSLAQPCSHLPSSSCLGMLHADSLRTLLILDQFPILQIVLVINTWVFMELDLDRCKRAHLGNIPIELEKRYDWTPLQENITYLLYYIIYQLLYKQALFYYI